jgi:hypothetical protein
MFGKRGIAPVISTILLLMFASALGIIVMSWGRAAVPADIPDCSKTSIKIISLSNKPHICTIKDKLVFTLENNGKSEIIGAKIIIISVNDIGQLEMDREIKVADIVQESLDFSGKDIMKIKFVPIIKMNNKEELCPNNGLELENIGEC